MGKARVCVEESEHIFSNNLEVTANTGRKKSRGKRNKIIHPIFIEMANVIQSPFWREVYMSAAMGKFPKRFSFRDGRLIYRRGIKNIMAELSTIPREAESICRDFFHVQGGIYSLEEDDFLAGMEEESLTWKTIKKKKPLQRLYIINYLEDVAKRYTLNSKEKLQLKHEVNLAFSLDYIKDEYVVFTDKIEGITNLHFDENNRKFYVYPSVRERKRSSNRAKEEPITSYYWKWRQLLESMKANRFVQSKRLHIVASPEIDANTTPHDSSLISALGRDEQDTHPEVMTEGST